MICPKCLFAQPDGRPECARCGIIFDKYFKSLPASRGSDEPAIAAVEEHGGSIGVTGSGLFKGLICSVEPEVNPIYFTGRALVYLSLLIWGMKFIFHSLESNYVGYSFMHYINLPFHEAGHVIFSPLGRFMGVLGGTLAQLLMPLICMGALLFSRRDAFGASVALWWVAESFMDIAPYINDARDRVLILLGGVTGREAPGYHDWEYLLKALGWLSYDHLIAQLAYTGGRLLMVLALLWGCCTLSLQFKNLDRS